MASRLLTKSKYMAGLQCPLYQWLVFNDPEKVPEPDASTQRIFDQGHLVGEMAKKLFPDGIDVPHDDFMANLNRTKELLPERKPLFEPGFMAEGLFARLDILRPSPVFDWDIIEVKSSTSVKDENLHDISFQKLCCEKQGLKIARCFLAHINNQYVKDGEIDPYQLFTIEDVTDRVRSAGVGIKDRISEMKKNIASSQRPEVTVGPHCRSPYDCPVTDCWEALPESNIFSLHRGGKKCFDLFYEGIMNIRDIPDTYKLNNSQKIQKWCDTNGIPYIEKEPLNGFLKTLRQPLHYLDFETISPALPLFDGTRPYQRVPFQYSLHIMDGGRPLGHFSFLAEGMDDPRLRFLEHLQRTILPAGSIVTYNQSFEEGVLHELAESFPIYTDWVEQTCSRMVDLLKPFQAFHYYHPAQKGSASIKSVLPALTGKSYSGMAIADGDTASRAFLNTNYGNSTEAERKRVRADLEKYCGLDTEGMIWILDRLQDITHRQIA